MCTVGFLNTVFIIVEGLMIKKLLSLILSVVLLNSITAFGSASKKISDCPSSYFLEDVLKNRLPSNTCPRVALMNAVEKFRGANFQSARDIFGESVDWSRMVDIMNNKDLLEENLPEIVLINSATSELLSFNGQSFFKYGKPPVMGAYGPNTIYIAEELFLSACDNSSDTTAAAIMVQELAHHFDSILTRGENEGSEGAIAGLVLSQDTSNLLYKTYRELINVMRLSSDKGEVKLTTSDGDSLTIEAEMGWWSWKSVAVGVGVGVVVVATGGAVTYYIFGETIANSFIAAAIAAHV